MIEKTSNIDFTVEDLMGVKNAPADYRVTRKNSYALLFKLNEKGSELFLIKCDNNGYDRIIDLRIPEKVAGYKVTGIRSAAFYRLNIDSIVIPDTVESIEQNAFGGCKIHELFIPASVSEIKSLVVQGCTIYKIIIDKNNKRYDSRDDCNAIIDTTNNELVAGSINSTIPNTVTSIGDGAFVMCQELKEIDIPQSVAKIGEHAFGACHGLEKAKIASSIIGESAFYGCDNLKEVWFHDSVTKIETDAFHGCECLKEVVIPNSVTIIEAGAFQWCKSLVRVSLPNSLTEIGDCAFIGCYNLKEAVLPNSITEISEGAFAHCESLKILVLPNSIKGIGAKAFRGCSSLERMVIPDSVIKIGESSFMECRSLEKVVIPDSVTEIGRSAFFGCNKVQFSINKPSLLRLTNEEPYDIKLSRMEHDKEYLHDPNFLQFRLHHVFRVLCEHLYDSPGITNPNTINDTLLDLLRTYHSPTPDWGWLGIYGVHPTWWWDFIKEIGFVKFIHIFDYSLDNNTTIGDIINLNMDMSSWHTHISNNNKEFSIDERNTIFDNNSIILTLLASRDFMFDKNLRYFEQLEYSTSLKSVVLDGNYQAVLANNDIDGCVYYDASAFLANNCDVDKYIEENKSFFHHLDSFSDTVTNYFYLASLSYDNRFEDFCLLLANIGVDSTITNTDCVKVFLLEFKAFLDAVSNLVVNAFQGEKRRQQAIEGAISKVMSRNSEHNHGSHVLAHLTDSNSYNRLGDKEIINSFTSYVSNNNVFYESKNMQLPYFFQYLRNRESYQSEAVFGVSNILTSKEMYGDVFKEFDQVRILLNYISGISGFSYKFHLLYNGEELNNNNDIAVAMPSDVIGCQAFYVIIENIIRNTAKHATKQPGCVTTFTINFSTIESHRDYYCVEIDNGIKEDEIIKLVEGQNELINESILDEDFNLRNYGLGLIEMETATAFLRQIPIAKIDSYEYRFKENEDLTNEQNNLIILKAINKNGALGYRFFLQKPKEILFVGDYPLDPFKKDMMNREGVQFISEKDFTKAMHEGQSFSHPFLLYSDKLKDETKTLLSKDSDCKTLLPIRKVMLLRDEINEVVNNTNSSENVIQKLKDLAWKKYMQSIGVDNNDIYFGSAIGVDKSSNCRQVVFANHGTKLKHDAYWSNRERLPELWVDNLSSYTQSKLPFFAQYSSGENCTNKKPLKNKKPLNLYLKQIPPQLRLEIYEAYHNKVVVLDERIQRFARERFEGSSDKDSGPIPVSDLFESTNVIIPKTKLDPEQFNDQTIQEIERFLNEETNNASLLIHYGILERMYKTEQVITEKLETWAKKAKRVVVSSGRGSHSLQLPDSVCFANLSSVLNAFTENRNKYLINCLINQSRRKNE